MSTHRVSEDVIQVESLSKTYGQIRAINEVSFAVNKGEIFGFLGPNGAGKTTTLTILEGLRQADRGRVTILGMDVRTSARSIKRRIGVQLQSTSLLPDLTVFEQVQLFARLYGCRPDKHEILTLLQQVGLSQKASALPDNLSGGQQQRLALALALINGPEIIFLDEPTTGLDPQSRRMLWQIIRELQKEGKTVILTTHYMEEAEVLCDRIQHIFQRLALTPVPLANLMVGAASTQILIGIGQGMLILLFGIFLVGLEMVWQNVLLVLVAMVLAGAAFIAFGSLIAAFTSKADIAGYLFFFTIMPLTFLASFPPEMMPDSLNAVTPWLPTSMAIELIGPLFLNNQLSDEALLAGVGLVSYTVLFAAMSIRRFRWAD